MLQVNATVNVPGGEAACSLCSESRAVLAARNVKLFFNCVSDFHTRVDWGYSYQDTLHCRCCLGLSSLQHQWNFTHAHMNLQNGESVDTIVLLGSSWKILPFHRLPEPRCWGILWDHFTFLLCSVCMLGRTCWGLDANTTQMQPPTLLYRAPRFCLQRSQFAAPLLWTLPRARLASFVPFYCQYRLLIHQVGKASVYWLPHTC